MARVAAFHTNTTSSFYHPLERYVYHDQSDCPFGQLIKRDGNDIRGSAGRELCDRCAALATAPSP